MTALPLPFPPCTKNNNYSTAFFLPLFSKPQTAPHGMIRRERRSSAALGQGPPRGRITGRTVPLCLSGVIGHMLRVELASDAALYRGEVDREGEEERT